MAQCWHLLDRILRENIFVEFMLLSCFFFNVMQIEGDRDHDVEF